MEYEREGPGNAEFIESASVALEREAEFQLDNAIDRLSALESTWHPNGFAVFHLNENHELGKLRLHIWPDSKRVTRPDDAPIHTHAWHLCSHILVGTYAETLYEQVRPGSPESREYHSAVIDYLVDRNSFKTLSKAHLRPASKIKATRGERHLVPAEVPHEAHIGISSFVATLLLTSHPVSGQAVMYSPDKIQASTYHRPALDRGQKIELISRLEKELQRRPRLEN